MTGRTTLTDEQREFLSERIYGQKNHAGMHKTVRTGKRARFRNKLGGGEWLFPGPGRNNRNLKRMPRKIDGQGLTDEYGWDYPVCEQWKEGYAFDITTGQSHEEIIEDDFYWRLVLPLTQKGGNLPYFGFTNHHGGNRLKSNSNLRSPYLKFKKEENKCTHCGSKNMTDDVDRGEIICGDCGLVAGDMMVGDLIPEVEIISRGQDVGTRYEELNERREYLTREIYSVGQIAWMKDIDHGREFEIKNKIFKALTTEKRVTEDFRRGRFKEYSKFQEEKKEFRKTMRNQADRDHMDSEGRRLANKNAKKLEKAMMNITEFTDSLSFPVAAYVHLRRSKEKEDVKNGWTYMTVDVANAIVDGKLEYRRWFDWPGHKYVDIELREMGKTELKNMAKAEGIEGFSSMKMEELITKLADIEEGWVPVVSGSKDAISEALIKEAQRLIDKGDWGSELRPLFGIFISINKPLWLEFASAISLCSTAKDGGSGEVTIRNEDLRELHEGMLGKATIQDQKRTANLSKPKRASGFERSQLSSPLEFEWNYMSILAVVSMVRMYFLFFEDKTVRWN